MRACPGRLSALVLAALLAAPVSAQEGDADLEALRRAIEERRERVAVYEREARGLFRAIEAVDAAILEARREVDRIGREAEAAGRRLAAVEAESQGLEQRVARTRAALETRVVALYKEGALGPVRLVFADGTLRDRLGRIQAIQRMAEHDARLLEQLNEEETALRRAREEAALATRRRDEAQAALQARTRELEEERAAKRTLLARAREDRARERAVLAELEAAARALEETLARVREQSIAPAPEALLRGFAGLEGTLEAPVTGSVLRRFGKVIDAEFRTATFRKGVDFAVAVGDPVYGVADGYVRFAGWLGGYGRMLIIDHGEEYFTVFGHLDEIDVEVGERVAAGAPLGRAGDTGSLSGPRLYFEIRKGSQALDPARWLR
ncbi:MAG: peptidoglycan DD-metalloendopeptidase family protein [Myxococcota bacterium]|nr:peptidoglycan DD-metalloendopeptidase family protein [Myxococcota bacterium]